MNLTIEKNLRVAMRDGVEIATDVYRPIVDDAVPVVMLRLPYNKEQSLLLFLAGDVLRIAQAGYAVVVQDCRGTFQSDGKFEPYFQEAEDGVDAISWAAAQPWSNGIVGMMGASYYGATQWLAASERPPALKAIAPFITTDQYYDKWTYQGGALQLGFILQWVSATFGVGEAVRRFSRAQATPEDIEAALDLGDAVAENYSILPITEIPRLTELAPYLKDWLAHPEYDAYWRSIAPREHHATMNIPALNFGGWYDLFLGGTLANYNALKNRAPQKLVIGPWAHGYNGGVYPERNFGMRAHDAVADVTGQQIRWFDRWLKAIDNGAETEPPVKIFVMGPDIWREEEDWPLPDTQWQKLFLHSNGEAAKNGGQLSFEPPSNEPSDSYVYDPNNPVPTIGGATFLPGLFVAANAGPRDQRAVEQRADVLCYDTPVLEEKIEITGPVTATFFVRSSAPDTDFTGKLIDVYPDGRAMLLTDGILRARYRAGFAESKLMTIGEIYELTVDLVATSNVFAAGHRIRLEISSSNFPRFDRNTNTGGVIAEETETNFRIANNEILHDTANPSHVLVPIIRRD